MTLERNLADLQGHAADFAQRTGFTFTVLDPAGGDVIGCVYLYPPASEARWIAADWPWKRVSRCGR
jgi:hypothetical protein